MLDYQFDLIGLQFVFERRHSIVGILIIAAVVTPTTDPITMTVFALPMFLLYEISIWIAGIAARKRAAIHSTTD